LRFRSAKTTAEHRIYPYLLCNLAITHPNQVWSADITYIPMQHGFMYLVAAIDWYSRYILAWQLSDSLTVLLGNLGPNPIPRTLRDLQL